MRMQECDKSDDLAEPAPEAASKGRTLSSKMLQMGRYDMEMRTMPHFLIMPVSANQKPASCPLRFCTAVRAQRTAGREASSLRHGNLSI